jgi:hypothetical protein
MIHNIGLLTQGLSVFYVICNRGDIEMRDHIFSDATLQDSVGCSYIATAICNLWWPFAENYTSTRAAFRGGGMFYGGFCLCYMEELENSQRFDLQQYADIL